MRHVFLDLETTGFGPTKQRVVEIGCVEVIDRELTGNVFHRYLNPERTGTVEAIKVHGLTDAFLMDKPKFAEVSEELSAFLRGAVVLAHNAPFDEAFLNAELRRLKRPLLRLMAARVVDTLPLAKHRFPGLANDLGALCQRLSIDSSHRVHHGALLDAHLLVEVYHTLTINKH
jgi:DNA polymerase-3 subunit epsilon